jgi:hypothetical protein
VVPFAVVGHFSHHHLPLLLLRLLLTIPLPLFPAENQESCCMSYSLAFGSSKSWLLQLWSLVQKSVSWKLTLGWSQTNKHMEWFYELLLNCYGCINNGTVVTRHSQRYHEHQETFFFSGRKPESFCFWGSILSKKWQEKWNLMISSCLQILLSVCWPSILWLQCFPSHAAACKIFRQLTTLSILNAASWALSEGSSLWDRIIG